MTRAERLLALRLKLAAGNATVAQVRAVAASARVEQSDALAAGLAACVVSGSGRDFATPSHFVQRLGEARPTLVRHADAATAAADAAAIEHARSQRALDKARATAIVEAVRRKQRGVA